MKPFVSLSIAVAVLTTALAGFAHAVPMPSWDKQIGKGRFKVLEAFAAGAVLDKETGLVWQETPGTSANVWANAVEACALLQVGGRKGWRLPAMPELLSLVDTANSSPTLPTGHPFAGVDANAYWTANTYVFTQTEAFGVQFSSGAAFHALKSSTNRVWCVRGGPGFDTVP